MPPSGAIGLLREQGWKNTGLPSTTRVSGSYTSVWSREIHDEQPRQLRSIPSMQKHTIGASALFSRALACVVYCARQTSNVLPSDRQTSLGGRRFQESRRFRTEK